MSLRLRMYNSVRTGRQSGQPEKQVSPPRWCRPKVLGPKPIKIGNSLAASNGLWPAQVQELGKLDKGLKNYCAALPRSSWTPCKKTCSLFRVWSIATATVTSTHAEAT